jgi:hypothetical protein
MPAGYFAFFPNFRIIPGNVKSFVSAKPGRLFPLRVSYAKTPLRILFIIVQSADMHMGRGLRLT